MKKFFVFLLFLLILGGAAFFFGWAQLKVPVGSYGVVQSKTHGVDQRVIKSGDFRWIWYKLIPTNVVIVSFSLEPENYSININNTLPSGSTYAEFAGISADFSWEIKASFSFRLNQDYIVQIVSENNIYSQDELRTYSRNLSEKIEALILRQMVTLDNTQLEELFSGGTPSGSSTLVEQEVKRQFPQINDFSFTVSSCKFPDFVLYRQVRRLYEEFLEKQQEHISAVLGNRAQNRIETQLRFAELEHYGQLLEKYPILLEYLALEKKLP